MYYIGLIKKFKINRPLTDEERYLQLRQDDKSGADKPLYFYSTIKINSVFLESSDKYYGWKGFVTLITMLILILLLSAVIVNSYIVLTFNGMEQPPPIEGIYVLIFFLVLFTPLSIFAVWGLKKESFAYTHYPIRFNRKTRMVYVFRLNGTVLSTAWDKLFVTFGRENGFSNISFWDMRAHVLDADGVTVRETFALAPVWTGQDDLRRYWEYLCRYMEEGPQSIIDSTPVYLPISDQRETWSFGLRRLAWNFYILFVVQILFLPFFLLVSVGRVFAMRTSRIPVWPKEIEDVNVIEPGDTYERDARNNPVRLWNR